MKKVKGAKHTTVHRTSPLVPPQSHEASDVKWFFTGKKRFLLVNNPIHF